MTEQSTDYAWIKYLRNEVSDQIKIVIQQTSIDNQVKSKEVFLIWVSNIKTAVEDSKWDWNNYDSDSNNDSSKQFK